MSDEKKDSKEAKVELSEEQRVDACKKAIAAACQTYRCEVVAYRTEEAVGDSGSKWQTALHVGVRPLASVAGGSP